MSCACLDNPSSSCGDRGDAFDGDSGDVFASRVTPALGGAALSAQFLKGKLFHLAMLHANLSTGLLFPPGHQVKEALATIMGALDGALGGGSAAPSWLRHLADQNGVAMSLFADQLFTLTASGSTVAGAIKLGQQEASVQRYEQMRAMDPVVQPLLSLPFRLFEWHPKHHFSSQQARTVAIAKATRALRAGQQYSGPAMPMAAAFKPDACSTPGPNASSIVVDWKTGTRELTQKEEDQLVAYGQALAFDTGGRVSCYFIFIDQERGVLHSTQAPPSSNQNLSWTREIWECGASGEMYERLSERR